jgi:chromosome segregation ATPase
MSTESTPAVTHDGDVYDAPAAFAARRAPRISQADVFRAADELLVQGDRPTIDRVRMRLGRGSPNTINDHLDAWWAKLGSRLRDLPGHEFPQLPERVAQALQHLWNEALEGAHAALQDTLLKREQALAEREHVLKIQTEHLTAREQAGVSRAAAVEESLAFAREQLSAANRRAETLETTLRERDTECVRLRTRIETLETFSADLRGKFDAATATYQTESGKLQEHYATAEARWMTEVDRARQGAKDAVKEYERIVKELRTQIGPLQTEHDHLLHELVETRAELKTAAAVREQLEERLRALPNPHEETQTAGPKSRRLRKRKRSMP